MGCDYYAHSPAQAQSSRFALRVAFYSLGLQHPLCAHAHIYRGLSFSPKYVVETPGFFPLQFRGHRLTLMHHTLQNVKYGLGIFAGW